MADERIAEGPEAVWLRRLGEGALSFQRCTACEAAVFPPRVACPACGAPGLEWRDSHGAGSLYSISWVSRRDAEPYGVALVDLDDGVRLMARLEGAAPEEAPIGMRVRAAAGLVDGAPGVVARPDGGAGDG